MQVMAHNLAAMNANNCLGKVSKRLSKTTEKLSSGYRINRSADDAAGLAISEKMRWQIRGLNAASRNIQDGISYCNVADGALSEVHSILDRMKELSVQAANDTNTESDRAAINQEIQQLKEETDRTFQTTEFNVQKIWAIPMIPSTGGIAHDFSFYNATDDKGSYIGGIEYMKHRYSWEDMGIGYDRDTCKFTQTKEVDSSAFLADDASTGADDYNNGTKASFTVKVNAGERLDQAQKTYSWSMGNNGIKIDGVALDGTDPKKGNTTWTAMGITPGQRVSEGTYNFNYYGTEVSFDVPSGGLAWDEFESEINTTVDKVKWHSVKSGASSSESAVIKSMTNKITVTNSNKDKISDSSNTVGSKKDYNVVSDQNGMTVEYNNGKVQQTQWNAIKDTTTNAYVGTWGEKQYDTKNNISIDEEATYGYDDTSKGGFINFTFGLDKDGDSDAITSDLNSTIIRGSVVSPTAASVSNTGTANTAESRTAASASCNFEFCVQRDTLGRAYNNNNEDIASGNVTESAGGGYDITFTGATDVAKTLTMHTSTDIKKDIVINLKNAKSAFEQRVTANGQSLTDPRVLNASVGASSTAAYFTKAVAASEYTARNNMTISYDLSGIKYQDVNNLSTEADFENLAQSIISANAAVTAKGNGDTYQNLTYSNASKTQSHIVSSTSVDVYMELNIQAGAQEGQNIQIKYDLLRTSLLGIEGIDTLSHDSSEAAITQIDSAIDKVSQQRSLFGAYINRLEHAYNADTNTAENTQAAESKLRDSDMAAEMVQYSRDQILMQVGQSILAQANQSASGILSLLQ